MSDMALLAKRRKQLRYRANHRGIKEMDIILGRFADKYLEQFDMGELDRLEDLMEQNDRDLLQWFTSEKLAPEEFNTDLFQQILQYAKSNLQTGKSDK